MVEPPQFVIDEQGSGLASWRLPSLPWGRPDRDGAYSSSGQSPRLITGLFQVRTLVGPPDVPRDHEGVALRVGLSDLAFEASSSGTKRGEREEEETSA